MTRVRIILISCAILAIGVVLFLLGFMTAKTWYEEKPVAIVAKPAVKIKDGLRLETKPVDHKTVPRNTIAKGQIKVSPKPLPYSQPGCSCDEITLDYTERLIDGQPAMEVTSKDAEITGGYHSPIDFKMRQERPWTIGVSYDSQGRKGAFIDRDIGPFSAGVGASGGVVQARIGYRF